MSRRGSSTRPSGKRCLDDPLGGDRAGKFARLQAACVPDGEKRLLITVSPPTRSTPTSSTLRTLLHPRRRRLPERGARPRQRGAAKSSREKAGDKINQLPAPNLRALKGGRSACEEATVGSHGRKSYQAALDRFMAWCAKFQVSRLSDPDVREATVLDYLDVLLKAGMPLNSATMAAAVVRDHFTCLSRKGPLAATRIRPALAGYRKTALVEKYLESVQPAVRQFCQKSLPALPALMLGKPPLRPPM